MTELRHSPLDAEHRALGAKLVDFGGWEMPLAYQAGTIAEHMACRTDAVVFDVSHLGTVRVEGDDALDRLQSTLTNDLEKIAVGRAQYTHLLDDDGSVLDDIIVWWVSEGSFDVMPNASNTARVRGAIGGDDVTGTRAIIAVQGPHARERLSTVSPEAAAVPRFGVARVAWQGVDMTVAGTGYTGEDGVERAVPVEAASDLWRAALSAGVVPAGLGARDTLRLEAACLCTDTSSARGSLHCRPAWDGSWRGASRHFGVMSPRGGEGARGVAPAARACASKEGAPPRRAGDPRGR